MKHRFKVAAPARPTAAFFAMAWALAAAAGEPAAPPSPAELGVDHVKLIRDLDDASLKRGETIFTSLCISCHGTPEKPGSLPTSRAFWKDPFKNGADLYGIYTTLTNGLGQMPPWPMLTPTQKYDVAYFIREHFVKPTNAKAYQPVTPAYLASLPKPRGEFVETAEMKAYRKGPKYLRMDFGPALMWTLEVARGNIACKGIAARLDQGSGGVSKGHAWIVYDHDTMRAAAAWAGDKFVDWRGIAFDGSHGTHTGIVGEKAWVNPDAPGWANPATGDYEDKRLVGLDGNHYGPLPAAWLKYRGMYQHDGRIILNYTVGKASVLESPGCEVRDGKLVFNRNLEIGPCDTPLEMRVCPLGPAVALSGARSAQLAESGGFAVLRVPARKRAGRVRVSVTSGIAAAPGFLPLVAPPVDLSSIAVGGSPLWPATLTSQVAPEATGGGLAYDPLAFPAAETNPWHTQWRPGGLDFFSDGKRLALCTWMGDVWVVGGITDPSGRLTWKRIAAGLFQPLGLKIVRDEIYITCRDQLVRLRDTNGDGETDYYECFNSDHQVTEHFHEFAMGLQTDSEGNFYYAKSARHGRPPLVPQHGTLLRVSRDGSRTDIVANGFRAANGVCVNDDGTFYLTDQQGHWTPDNRIELVRPGRFYGNMLSYGAPQDSSDSLMEKPMMWLTGKFDRSPGELIHVTPESWAPLDDHLIDMSYGMGRMFLILRDRADPDQGAAVALPLPDFPTGVMRGRFHPGSGDLYVCGMAVWASNKIQDGGLYRVRRTATPLHLPIAWRTRTGAISITFSEPLDPAASADTGRYTLRTWDLRRSGNYGSPHLNEKTHAITRATLSADGRTLTLGVPDLAPTRGLALEAVLTGEDGKSFTRRIDGTIYRLAK